MKIPRFVTTVKGVVNKMEIYEIFQTYHSSGASYLTDFYRLQINDGHLLDDHGMWMDAPCFLPVGSMTDDFAEVVLERN